MVDGLEPALLSLLGRQGAPQGLRDAFTKSAGARFHRCALQVNPYAYGERHAKPQSYADEGSYNAAVVTACQAANVTAVAITDHFRVASSSSLAASLEAAGIVVFPGFEANTSEGIHLLCLFPSGTPYLDLERFIGGCELASGSTESPQSTKSCEQLMTHIADRGGLCIAAHVCSASGLLKTLSGQARGRAWRSPHLLAAAVAGRPNETPQAFRDILFNKDVATKRDRPLALINANDVSNPGQLSEPSTTTWIKMAEPSIEGLRQAFLDPGSRIRLNSEEAEQPHTEIIAVSWSGGLLDGQAVCFNESLNVLIGGRGAGKSTLIESVRYALQMRPRAADAAKQHDSMMKAVLGTGTEVSVLLRCPRPSQQYYLVQRIYGQRARVRDQNGGLLDGLSPADIAAGLEIYGQHEISELTRHPDQLAMLLRRFTNHADGGSDKIALIEELGRSRRAIMTELEEIEVLEDALTALPALREQLRRFTDAGLADRLSEKTAIGLEEDVIAAGRTAIESLRTDAAELVAAAHSVAPILPEDGAPELPNRAQLRALAGLQGTLSTARLRAAAYLAAVAARASVTVDKTSEEWQPFSDAANDRYLQAVSALEAEGHDPRGFISVQEQAQRLKPKEEQLTERAGKLERLLETRRELIASWENARAADLRTLERAARAVSLRLKGRVRVSVRPDKTLASLEATIKAHVQGNISQPLERLRQLDALDTSALAENVRGGALPLVASYGFSQLGAEKIAEGGTALALAIEEVDLPAVASVELNVGTSEAGMWKPLDDLSTGQKATAVLLLLLLESEAPLIVDQPEDDLDNRFIAECIVPAIREEKRRRQFIFSSHNANIPVLGDAEQIIGLDAHVEAGSERAIINDRLRGSIDTPAVKDSIKNLLEGGEEAFATRRAKYGF
jgi:energy-coupling factor transporter ATP-binding protein EcfA2